VGSCAYIAAQMKYHTPHDLWGRINTVHCGLAPDTFAGDPAPLPDALTFLSIGRFSPEKGHLVLLEAFAAVSKDHPQARLVLAGDGPMRGTLETRIKALGLGDAVRITGWINSDQVKQEIRAASTLVHPSFTEGLPVVIMEAMAEARPGIATYIAGIPELVQEGKTGWLVPAGLVDELAAAMIDLARMPKAEAAELGRAGLERVRHRHDVAIEAGKLKTIFGADQP
jgi:glycosyltransferase involved in cell wall biosynthesis